MENLKNTRTILNEDACNDKVGQVEFTREFSTRSKFEEWLKVEQNTTNWSLRSKTGPEDKPKSPYGWRLTIVHFQDKSVITPQQRV